MLLPRLTSASRPRPVASIPFSSPLLQHQALRYRRTVHISSRRQFFAAVGSEPAPIPVVEFGEFLTGTLHRNAVAKEVVRAFKEVGFVYLAKTGVCEGAERERIFGVAKAFFDLPLEKKSALAWETPESNRGYVAHGRERVTQATSAEEIARLRESAPDYKESLEIGRDYNTQYSNRWPSESDLAGFRYTMNGFFKKCHELHLEVMRSLALGLGIGETYFDKLCDAQSHNLRLLSYPSVQRRLIENGGNRAGAHSDYGTVTLLFQDAVGGLEVQDAKTGAFVSATPIPDTIVVNVGDLLSRWSNDILRSTLHRVVLPPSRTGPDLPTDPHLSRPSDMIPARQSIAFFSNPNMETIVSTLPGTGEPKYGPVKTHDYLVKRLSETYT